MGLGIRYKVPFFIMCQLIRINVEHKKCKVIFLLVAKPTILKVIFLGTGTSQGVPVIGCHCKVCKSEDPRDERLRTSIYIETQGKAFVIDTGPDFRQQMLTNGIDDLDAILFTHEHKDHVAGLDDVRAFNYILGRHMDVYAEDRVQKALKREFAYVFADKKYPGVPQIELHLIHNEAFEIQGVPISPIRVMHHKLPVLGFRLRNFAYLTDLKSIPEQEKTKLQNLDCLVITALRKEPHISHMNLDEALECIEELKPRKAYLTHISHKFGLHAEESPLLPEHVEIAYDGLKLEL